MHHVCSRTLLLLLLSTAQSSHGQVIAAAAAAASWPAAPHWQHQTQSATPQQALSSYHANPCKQLMSAEICPSHQRAIILLCMITIAMKSVADPAASCHIGSVTLALLHKQCLDHGVLSTWGTRVAVDPVCLDRRITAGMVACGRSAAVLSVSRQRLTTTKG